MGGGGRATFVHVQGVAFAGIDRIDRFCLERMTSYVIPRAAPITCLRYTNQILMHPLNHV